MALLMLVATLWSVAQLTVLSSWSRTVRFSTLVLVVAFGAYACGVVVVLLQWGWTRLYSALTHTPLGRVVDTASYTVDPVIEEVVKVLPLVLVGVFVARASRQLGLTDYLLVGAATGAGFTLFESLMRFGTVRALSMSLGDGYIVQASLGGAVVVPGIGSTLRSWLPEPVTTEPLLGPASGGVSHLAWSALAGVGVGWFWRRSGARRWFGVVPLAYACLDHMLYNYVVAASTVTGPLAPVNTVVGWLHQRLGSVVVVVLVAAVVIDRLTLRFGREAHPEVLLPSEPPDGLEVGPLWSVVRAAPPWTALVAARFVLSRRAGLYARALDPADTRLLELVAQTRAQLERAQDPARWAEATRGIPRTPAAVLGMTGRLLRDWRVVVWLVVLLPSLLYLVIGGFPATRGLQEIFRSTAGAWVLVAGAAVGLVLLVVQLVPILRARHTVMSLPDGETIGRYLVRVATGTGAIVAGVVLVVAAVTAGRPADRTLVQNTHALDALGSLLLVLGLALFLWGLIMFPPFALAVTTLGTIVLVPTVTGAFVMTTVGAAVLGSLGVYLNAAADGGSGPGGSGLRGGSETGPSAQPNFQDPSVAPGPGWEWRGQGAPGSDRGAWYNPTTRETLHPDLEHGQPIGPHYDWRSPDGYFYRIFRDGRIVPR
ncbi:MAG: polymorphic toxin type 37 domain-containing protein [Lapillicoccus sp.]